jgi:hypothetical protein
VRDIVHFVMWLFVGAIAVLIVTHASGFSTAVNAVGGQLTNDAFLLSGGGTGATATSSRPPASWYTA